MVDDTQGNQQRFPLADLINLLGEELREAERRAAESGARNLQLKECAVQMGIQWEKIEFLERNGYRLEQPETDEAVEAMLGLASSELAEADFVEWVRSRLTKPR